MDIIRVTITGHSTHGKFPYRIETDGTTLTAAITGNSVNPLLDACRVLQSLGVADEHAQIGLYNPGTGKWQMKTTVGYGAKTNRPATPAAAPVGALEPVGATGVAPPPENAPGPPPGYQETASEDGPTPALQELLDEEPEPSAAKSAKSSAAPPPPSTPPAPPAGKGRAEPAPAKPKSSPPKPKPKGSAAPRGRR